MSKYKRIRRKFIRNGKYWRDRSVQAEAAKQAANEKTFAEIEKIYRNAQKELDAEIDKWYARVALNNDISLADAHKLLYADQLDEFHWDVKEYIHKCKEAGIYKGKWSKQLENASAKVHISRLEALKIRTQQSLEILYAKEHNMLKNAFSDAYKTGYYQSFFEFHKAAGIGFDVGMVDNNALEKLLYKPWAADGRNFSERIWGNKYQMINTLHKELTQHIMLGQSVEKTADRIARDAVRRGSPALDLHTTVKEKLKYAKMNARRLVQTESAYFHSMGQKQMFDDLDVEKYEYVATIDSHTSEICAAMDGKVFDMKDYETGVTAPPLHVNCRSTTAPYFDDEYELELEADKEVYELPGNISYGDWKNAFVAGGDKSGFKKLPENDLTKGAESGIINIENKLKVEDYNVHTVGHIDIEKYRCVTEDITTDEVIITDERIQHIKDHHPGHFEIIEPFLQTALDDPDYILEDKAPYSGLILKLIEKNGLRIQMVVRLHTSADAPDFKNSIISAWKISESRCNNYTKNKKILYKRE